MRATRRHGPVEEREVVMFIHEHGKLTSKEIGAKFKYGSMEKAEKAQFIQLVKRVAKTVRDEGQLTQTTAYTNDKGLQGWGRGHSRKKWHPLEAIATEVWSEWHGNGTLCVIP